VRGIGSEGGGSSKVAHDPLCSNPMDVSRLGEKATEDPNCKSNIRPCSHRDIHEAADS
jgi:hypothetical protein